MKGDRFMKPSLVCVAALALAVLFDSRAMAQRRGPVRGDQPAARRKEWLASLDDGLAESRRTGKPLMVVIRCVP